MKKHNSPSLKNDLSAFAESFPEQEQSDYESVREFYPKRRIVTVPARYLLRIVYIVDMLLSELEQSNKSTRRKTSPKTRKVADIISEWKTISEQEKRRIADEYNIYQ